MRLINTNLLNYFYKNGVKPLKNSLAKKFDASKLVNNLLTTASGFALDARQGPVIQGELDEINSKLGTVYTNYINYTAEGTELNGNTYYSVCYMNLQPGTYILIGTANIASKQSAIMYQGFSTDDGTNYGLNSITGTQRYLPSIYIFELNQAATIYLRVHIGYAAKPAGSVHGREMMAIKLK